jgi:putative ABC transport system substrate-binding protein
MRRRDFITLVGGAAAAWPLAARAQQAALPVVGYLSPGTPAERAGSGLPPFREGLSEMGYVEGRNLAIEYRFAQNDINRVPELAADLIRRRVAVIVANGGNATLVVKPLTSTIPIVFGAAGDPVELGIVASLNRPGGNVTGIASLGGEVERKQFGLIHQLLPLATRFAILWNPGGARPNTTITGLRAVAQSAAAEIDVLYASSNADIDKAFADLVQKRTDALLVQNEFLFRDRRAQILTLAARYAVPVIYGNREDVEAGGLMSYGTNRAESNRQLGLYTGRILKGEKAADLPVLQSTKFQFLINLQTAKTLGIEVPPTLLALADEVIE